MAQGSDQEEERVGLVIRTLGMPESMWNEIDVFRARERITSRQEAVRRLILMGLREAGIADGKTEGEPD